MFTKFSLKIYTELLNIKLKQGVTSQAEGWVSHLENTGEFTLQQIQNQGVAWERNTEKLEKS